jgi:hypothetical protein
VAAVGNQSLKVLAVLVVAVKALLAHTVLLLYTVDNSGQVAVVAAQTQIPQVLLAVQD